MSEKASAGYGFGTFKGVFMPSILTILGVVMYLRTGWVLGNVGLPTTIIIVTLASSITFLTAMSLAALATNMRVGGGGAYFIISRSLGVETGAAVGLPLYLAQALGIAFYIAGFSESLVQIVPSLDPTVVGMTTLVAITALAYLSADFALKSQFVIMAAIVVSLASFFLGEAFVPDAAVAQPNVATLSFWPVFAVFFPAVTGIEAGIAMSGDLKNPTRSLPVGTILAVVVGYTVYVAIAVFLDAQNIDRQTLISDPLVMQKVARWGNAVLVGIWAASLSSAVGALLGAPRTLQALAKDRVVPSFIGRGFGKYNDPRIATLISFVIATMGIMLGDLNLIAPVLSMFFLTSYGVLNLSAGIESLISNAAWRPRFRIPTWVPIAGFGACLVVMLMIAPGATILAVLTVAAIYILMKRRSLRAEWGDIRLGLMIFVTRLLLYKMEDYRITERTWKPNLLVLSGSPTERWYLIELADAIAQSRSFVTVASFVPEKTWSAERLDSLAEATREYLLKREVPAFIRTLPAIDPFEGAATMIRSYGFGPLRPNTILIGETHQAASLVRYAELVQLVARSKRNLIVVREPLEEEGSAAPPAKRKRRIDVWWSPKSANTPLMIAVAVLLRRSEDWTDATLHLRTVVETEAEHAGAAERLQQFATDARVRATTEVLVSGDRTLLEVIREASDDAELVFMGLRQPRPDESAEEFSKYYAERIESTKDLEATVFVMAGEQIDFNRIFEDHG